MSPVREHKQNHWETVRGNEDRDNTARLVDQNLRSPWAVEFEPTKVSMWDPSVNLKTGKPRDALSGANESLNFAQDLSAVNTWLRVGTVFFVVLSIGLVLILISRAITLSAAMIP